MKRALLIAFVVLVIAVLALSACSPSPTPTKAAEEAEPTDVPVPATYAAMTNPHAGDAQAAAAGKTVYTTNCLSCHGAELKGDGPAGKALTPMPADLTGPAKDDSEQRIFWIISEGGAAAGMSPLMVPWKGTLSDDQRWQIVTYLKSTAK